MYVPIYMLIYIDTYMHAKFAMQRNKIKEKRSNNDVVSSPDMASI